MPLHKSGTSKFDPETHNRTLSPLTQEDIGQFGNLGLISTLRRTEPGAIAKNRNTSTIDNPPSFYEDDLRKKQDKYEQAIKERQDFKKKYQSNERRTIFTTSNDNHAEVDPDKKLQEVKYTGGQVQATRSEFKRVIQRRKSRLSVAAPTNIDIDFVGNSNDF